MPASARSTTITLGIAALVAAVNADVYMQHPRGSNNRLNEQSANRNNGNRLFDSQNNNRGGYNKGDVNDTAAQDDWEKQYDMVYYQSGDAADGGKSWLYIEWTNQHGCGGHEQGDPHKLNCDIVLQYMAVPVISQRGVSSPLTEYDYLSRTQQQLFRPEEDAVDKTAVQGTDEATHECFIPVAGNPTCGLADPANNIKSCPAMTGVVNENTCNRVGGV